jgi:glycosyltransferase involved in cell wall biosynthesis
LLRVYESLRKQTCKDFEWLVIDDGSTDSTEQIVKSWEGSADFPIRYISQSHQGKHAAFNRGVNEASGVMFAALDSDDTILPNTLERALNYWYQIPCPEKFVGVTGHCMDENGAFIGNRFPDDITDSDALEIRYKYKVKGEKWGLLRTSVLRQFPFPSIDGATFIPEGVIWSKIARSFKTRYVNECFRTYFQDCSANSDQLTKQPNPAVHAKAMAIWHCSILNDEIIWLRYAPKEFIRSAVHFARFSFHARKGLSSQFAALAHWRQKLLWFIGLPVGLVVYMVEKR